MLYDTHSHPYLADKKSQNHILENFFSGGGKYLNSISVDLESSQSNIMLAKSRQGIFAVIGVHPTHVLEYKDSLDIIFTTLEKLYIENKEYIVGLGETGLDYHCLEKLSENSGVSQEQIVLLQKKVFIGHIHLAKKLGIPIIIHNRDSSEDVFKILKQENFTNFVFHCFSEDLEYAHRLIEFAPQCKLGFGGVLTFKNAEKTRIVAAGIPLCNIIIETDSPYLTPMPLRGKEENEPLFTRYVLDQLGDIRNEDFIVVQEKVFKNSVDFFGLHKNN